MLAGTALAQTTTTLAVTGPSTVYPGQTIDLTVSLVNGGPLIGAGWQIPAKATVKPVQPPVANKSQTCGASACLMYGMNRLAIPDGVVQVLSYKVPIDAVPGSKITLSVDPTFGVDASGVELAVSNLPLTATVVTNPLDLNHDGLVDTKDYNLASATWLASQSKADGLIVMGIVVYTSN